MPARRLCQLYLGLCLALPCFGLEWKSATVTKTTAPFQTTQEVDFDFANHGTKPVTLLRLETSCDCLAAHVDRKVYAPGEAGQVHARFVVGDHSGLYERTITLLTDESPDPVRLMVRIEVPEICEINPRSLVWKVHAAADEQIVDVTPAPGLEIGFTDVQPTNDAFVARLETLEAGRRYRVHVKPRATDEPASVALRIFGREKSGHDIVVSAYARVE